MTKGRDLEFSGSTWILIWLVLSTSILLRVAKGEDCTRDGYYLIPRFGDLCQYRCRCVNEEQCDRQTGSCQNGCALGWMGAGCQYRNIVIYSTGSDQSITSGNQQGHPSLAIDGDKSTCSKAYSHSNSQPWWRVDFSKQFYLVGLVITLPETHNVKDLVVEGSNQAAFQSSNICYQHDISPVSNVLEIMCRNSLAVRHIRITTRTQLQALELCEVEIYGGRYVSYKANTEHSSIFRSWNGLSSKAVDGRPMLEGDNQEVDGERTCSVTWKTASEYWKVNLFDDLLIEGLNVYGRRLPDNPEYIGQIQGFRVATIQTGGLPKLIFTDDPPGTNWTYYQPFMLEIVQPVLAATLAIYRKPNINEHLSLCEVEIFAECKPGTCGWNCSDICHCTSVTTGSYRKDGICPYGCKPRWRGKGSKCDEACPGYTWGTDCTRFCHCFNDEPCDFYQGVCPNGCSAGWKSTAACNISCDAYTHGVGCSKTCGNCENNDICSATNGHCPGDCKSGWKGNLCTNPCAEFFYGPGCQKICGFCSGGDTCSRETGHCEAGCYKGYLPPLCQQECPGKTYGYNCANMCGKCADNESCDKVDGQCPGKCAPGWQGVLCQEPCHDHSYGPNCSSPCGHCVHSSPCDKVSGICSAGCTAGFKGSHCVETCLNSTYGADCINACGRCLNMDPCNITTGYCPGGCEPGQNEPFCQAQSVASDNAMIPVVIALIVAVALVAVAIAILLRRRSNRRHKALHESQELDIIPDKGSIEGKHVTVDIKVGEVVVEDDACDQVYVNSSALSEPIPLSQLSEYCHKVKLDPTPLFDDFKDLPHGLQFGTLEALKEENRSKNRYRDLYPYDKNVVMMPMKTGGPNTCYINASFIDGFTSKRRYIAAQGAMKSTVADVWNMVWTYDIAIIVMLTGCYEQGRHKCEQYWPEENSHQYGNIQVAPKQVDTYAEHTIRKFDLQKNGSSDTKRVTHYHFTGWPDKDVPDDTLSLVQFWRIVKHSEKAATSPWMVHCSAGIGRTGTFIAVDYLHDQGQSESYVDVKRCAHLLRDQRVNMVQTKDQYLFVHQAVNEALNPIGYSVHEEKFLQTWHRLQNTSKPTNVDSLYLEYKALSDDIEDFPEGNEYATFNTFLSSDDFRDSRLPENVGKSRDSTVLPPDRYRPRLGIPVEERNDFINAVLISTFRKKDGLILSQIPLESTVVDCLRLIWQYKISTVVVMETLLSEESTYWDTSSDSIKRFGPFTVQLVSEKSQDGTTVRNCSLQYTNSADELSFRHFHFERWQDNSAAPSDTSSMLTLMSEVENWYRTSGGDSAILVQCLDGATRSGLFGVMWSVLQRLKSDRTVAIAETVRLARVRRKQIIPSYEQYRYCWTAFKDYLEGAEVYGNVV